MTSFSQRVMLTQWGCNDRQLSVLTPLCPSVCLFRRLSLCMSAPISDGLYVYLPLYLSVFMFICPYICLSVCISAPTSVCQYIYSYLFICIRLSTCQSIYGYISLDISCMCDYCLSVRLCVCLSVSDRSIHSLFQCVDSFCI